MKRFGYLYSSFFHFLYPDGSTASASVGYLQFKWCWLLAGLNEFRADWVLPEGLTLLWFSFESDERFFLSCNGVFFKCKVYEEGWGLVRLDFLLLWFVLLDSAILRLGVVVLVEVTIIFVVAEFLLGVLNPWFHAGLIIMSSLSFFYFGVNLEELDGCLEVIREP